MSETFIDRFIANWSVDNADPITRSIPNADTSGFIRDGAPHWAIESFIPMQTDVLIDYLWGRSEIPADREASFRQVCCQVEDVMRRRTGAYHDRFSRQYWPVDPDNDSYVPGQSDSGHSDSREPGESEDDCNPRPHDVAGVLELCQEILDRAGYRQLSQEDIEKCVGVASQWGVPLSVDFDLFGQLLVFARGDVMGTKLRRRLRRLYRPEPVAVPIYQRMFVVFQLRSDSDSKAGEELLASTLHMRMFKNIPKQDVDMLLPCSRVRITKIDRVKIIAPSLGGLVISMRKIIQFLFIFAALTLYSTAVLVGLVLATIGYIIKSILSYSQTKNRYLLNLTRNLYFQKLDTNAGAAYRTIRQAHRQSSNEMILVYYAVLTSDEPISDRRLRRRCERMIREAIGVEVGFRSERALEQLAEMQRIKQLPDQRWIGV